MLDTPLPPPPSVPQGLDPLGSWLRQTFSFFGQNPKVWLLQGTIYFGVNLPFIVFTEIFSRTYRFTPHEGLAAMYQKLLFLLSFQQVLMLGMLFLTSYLGAGMTYTALKQVRNEPIAVGDLFKAGSFYLPVLAVSLIESVLLMPAACCFCIPVFLLGAVMLFTTPLIIDQRLGVFNSISQSFQVVRQNWLLFCLYSFIIGLFAAVGGATRLGIIVAIPIAAIGTVVAYVSLFQARPLPGMNTFPIKPADLPPPYLPAMTEETERAETASEGLHAPEPLPPSPLATYTPGPDEPAAPEAANDDQHTSDA